MSLTRNGEGKSSANLPFLVGLATAALFLNQPTYAIDQALRRFAGAKEQQVRELAHTITNKVPEIVWSFFDAVRVDDWQTATNLATLINAASQRYGQATNDDSMTPALATLIWPPISETYGAYGEFHGWNNRWLHRFANEIITGIPRGSIYFGGTDAGRFIVSAMSESQVEGKPFFTLTQNQLADQTYLDYLRVIYGNQIRIPTTNDARSAFDEYLKDVSQRRTRGGLKPGEDVRDVDGHIEVKGDVAVMTINGLIAKRLLAENPDREFFVEESYVLDWMYPQLTPHGLIFELHRQPLASIAQTEVVRDQDYWKKLTDEALGSWLDEKTSVKEITDFAIKYGSGKNLADYQGDKTFAANEASRKTFSKLRSSIAGMYAWRMDHAQEADERERMYRAADLALRQSYAICPYLPEAIYRYSNLLQSRRRTSDAMLIAKTSLHLDPENQQLQNLVSQLMER